MYAVTLVLSAVATALLITPVAVHRMVFHHGMRRQLVWLADRCAQAGIYVLLLTVSGASLLALDSVLDRRVALVVAGGIAALSVALWVVLPLVLRAEEEL